MIEPYNLSENSNISLMLDGIMEKTFFALVILITIWLIGSLIFWLIRKLYKVRKGNKIWYKKFYNKRSNTDLYTNCSSFSCFF